MKEPFDITVGEITYSVFPEEDDTFTIFKEGIEYTKIQKDTEGIWLKLDPETELPLFEEDTEVNEIGQLIQQYEGEEEDE